MAVVYLLFCTAQVPTTTIETLMQTPQHNFCSLVRDPLQSALDLGPTKPPITPFATGFLNYTSSQIQAFMADRVPTSASVSGSNIEPGHYALLDERSTRDNTVIIADHYSELFMRDPETMTDEESDQWSIDCDDHDGSSDAIWREWRVKFEDAYDLTTAIDFGKDFTPKLYSDEFVAKYTGDDGVFRYGRAHKEYLDRFARHEEL